MTTKEHNKKEESILPHDKDERKELLRKMMVYSELLKPKFDEGQE